jgi:hypothetical protein
MNELEQVFSASNNVRDLLLGLVTTDAFRYGRFDTETP